jgi:hypothetical protein
LASEGATFAPYIFEDAFNPANKSSKFAVASQAMLLSTTIEKNSRGSVKPQKFIVIYSKRSLHICEDCGICCEGEWEQQRHLDGHTGLVDFIGLAGFVGLVSFVGFICLVNFIGVIRLVGLIGFIGFVNFIGVIGLVRLNGLIRIVGLSCLEDLIGLVGFAGLIGIISFMCFVDFIGVVGLVNLVGLIGLCLIGNFCLGLVGNIGHGISFIVIGLFDVNGLISVGFVGLVSFVSLVGLSFIGLLGLLGLLGLIGFIGLLGLVGLVSISLNGLISISIIAISFGIVCIQFEIEMKQSQHYSFVREKEVACADSYFHTLLRPDSHFGDAIQDANQLFLSRLSQLTKYFVMRECENIPT